MGVDELELIAEQEMGLRPRHAGRLRSAPLSDSVSSLASQPLA